MIREKAKNIHTRAKHGRIPGIIIAISIVIVIVLAAFMLDEAGTIDLSAIFGGRKQLGDGTLRMYTIDVGHGDSMLIVSPGGKTMLVDAGDENSYDAVKGVLDELGVSELDIVIATHPHKDHIGSMEKIIRDYKPGILFRPNVQYDSKPYKKLIDAAYELQLEMKYAYGGDEIEWDEDCRVRVLAPVKDGVYSPDDMNEWSIILRIEYGENAILLAGDADIYSEQLAMLNSEEGLFKADVLKVAHHGSSSSTGEGFIQAVSPIYAVVSLGSEDGHKAITDELARSGVTVYRTDRVGTIIAVLTGAGVEVYPYGK